MKLKFNDLKINDANDIYEMIAPSLKKVYDKYSFIIDNEEFKQLVLKTIKAIKKLDLDESIDILSKIIDYLEIKLDEDVEVKLGTNLVYFVNKFININLDIVSNSRSAIVELEKFSFFSKYDCRLSLDDCVELINQNTKLNKLLNIIVINNIKRILACGSDAISNNEFVNSLIDAYCVINQLEEQMDDVEEIRNLDDSIGIYLSEIRAYPLLSLEEERKIALDVLKGDKSAVKKLINHNLRLVVSIARKYLNRGLSFNDLIQEGNLGLMKAVEKYDVNKGFRFSTYSTWWIRQAIVRAIYDSSRNIRIPVSTQELLSKLSKANNYLEGLLGKPPTVNELSEYLNMPVSKIIELQGIKTDTISLNNAIGEDGDKELSDLLSTDEDIEVDTEKNIFAAQFRQVLDEVHLTDKEYIVITMRYGLDGKEPATLEQIGQKLHVTRERVRQIEAKALGKLSRNKQIKDLYAEINGKALDLTSQPLGHRKYAYKNKIDSIYKTFSQYTKEEIDYMFKQLLPAEQNILHLKFGYNFNQPKLSSLWTDELEDEYRRFVLPKMRRIFEQIRNQRELKNKFNASIFLNITLRRKIAYESEPYTIEERLNFNNLVNDLDFQNSLKQFPELYSKILYYRLGIGIRNVLSLNAISVLVSLDNTEISNILMDIFTYFDNYINQHNNGYQKKKTQ